jgi:hypothetical protein
VMMTAFRGEDGSRTSGVDYATKALPSAAAGYVHPSAP